MLLFSPLMSEIVKQNVFCQFCSLLSVPLPWWDLFTFKCLLLFSSFISNLFSLFLNRWGDVFISYSCYHKFSDFKSLDLSSCSSGGQKLKMGLSELKSRCWEDYVSSGGCRVESGFGFVLSFLASRSHPPTFPASWHHPQLSKPAHNISSLWPFFPNHTSFRLC